MIADTTLGLLIMIIDCSSTTNTSTILSFLSIILTIMDEYVIVDKYSSALGFLIYYECRLCLYYTVHEDQYYSFGLLLMIIYNISTQNPIRIDKAPI